MIFHLVLLTRIMYMNLLGVWYTSSQDFIFLWDKAHPQCGGSKYRAAEKAIEDSIVYTVSKETPNVHDMLWDKVCIILNNKSPASRQCWLDDLR